MDFRCVLKGHRWAWFTLYDTDARTPINLHVSQCIRCRRMVGGWRGKQVLSCPGAYHD